MTDDLKAALERVFAADSEIYRGRGFLERIGYGERPALVNIDLANAWTRPGNPFTCDDMDVIIPGVQHAARRRAQQGNPDRLHDHRLRGS